MAQFASKFINVSMSVQHVWYVVFQVPGSGICGYLRWKPSSQCERGWVWRRMRNVHQALDCAKCTRNTMFPISLGSSLMQRTRAQQVPPKKGITNVFLLHLYQGTAKIQWTLSLMRRSAEIPRIKDILCTCLVWNKLTWYIGRRLRS